MTARKERPIDDDTPLLDLPLSGAAKRMVQTQSEYRVLLVRHVREMIAQNALRRWKGVGSQVERELRALLTVPR